MTIISSHAAYAPSILQQSQQTQKISANREAYVNSRAYKETDHSTVRPQRDGFIGQLNKVAGNDEKAENLLRNWARPDSGGMFSAGLPDLKNPDAMRRLDRISQLFTAESRQVESQKTELIAKGRDMGKLPQEILKDVFDLYDSQSDLFKFGRGWDGDVFAFDQSSPAGYERMLHYSSDVVDTMA